MKKMLDLEQKTYFHIYSVDYPINIGFRSFGPLILPIGVIEKDKYHDFIKYYREKSHDELLQNRKKDGYYGIESRTEWEQTTPFLKGKIIFKTLYKEKENEFSYEFTLYITEFSINSFLYNNEIFFLNGSKASNSLEG